jgi:outer membrane lipoprotein SlyB
MKKLLIILVFAALLSACATQSQQAKTEGTVVGSTLGALVGGGLGYAFGGNATSAAIGAGVGALLGGLGGYAYADNINKSNQELVGKENDIDAQIQIAKNINGQLQANNQDVEKKIAQFNQDITSLETQAKDQVNQRKKLEATKQQMNEEYNKVQKSLVAAKKSLSELERLRNTNSSQSKDLDAEIMKLKIAYNQLQQKSNALASKIQRI